MFSFFLDKCSSLISSQCCYIFFRDFNFANYECFSLVLSKVIGIIVIFFSSFFKLPQIIQILYYKNASGISISSIYLEATVNVLTLCFHWKCRYSITTYGEAFFVLAQNIVIGFLATHYDNKYPFLIWDIIIFSEFTLIFCTVKDIISLNMISLIWKLNFPLSYSYKVTQIYKTFHKKCKGELSTISSFIKVLGSMGRIFTTFREIKDMFILILYFINFLMNLTILFQCLHYPKKAQTFYN